uniref:Costars domain-containing protein n=1 Tax=Haptolina ericina TaxID=156174 RepID=A0A7S3AXQ9_9EUKA|mmetsp:Transcript_41065/g.92941  ORF Transcript_41065/g.92941 Transcript_41065/m.92941 type:complete len:269 (+) Transcript_41065:1-807(+)
MPRVFCRPVFQCLQRSAQQCLQPVPLAATPAVASAPAPAMASAPALAEAPSTPPPVEASAEAPETAKKMGWRERERLAAERRKPPEVVKAWEPPPKPKRTFTPDQLRETVADLRRKQQEYFEHEHATTSPNSRGVLADETYGTPSEGTVTFERAQAAHAHVAEEMCLASALIEEHGIPTEDGGTLILFGDIFEVYVAISDKVVGMLLRLRKHGMIYFEGESLFQTQDDDVPILQLFSAAGVRERLAKEGLKSGVITGAATTPPAELGV